MSVRVRFVDAANETVIGEADLAPEQLPESFAIATTLELAGKSWTVARAEPTTRAEYAASGRLTLWLRQQVVMDPREILYSLPTLNDALPAMIPPPSRSSQPPRVLELDEDDWRQVELVARTQLAVVEQQLTPIRAILAARTSPGFKTLHVRTQPATPLDAVRLPLDELVRLWPNAARYDGISIGFGSHGLVDGGFAFDIDAADNGPLAIYGQAHDGLVTTLALTRAVEAPPPSLRTLMDAHRLLLVAWCRTQVHE